MLNLQTFNCGLAFTPYVFEAAAAFLDHDQPISLVVRQGGTGLIIRSGAALSLRYQNRLAELSDGDVQHYLATTGFRVECFDIHRMSDEIVLANVGPNLLLSHPQSDLWLDGSLVSNLLHTWSERTVRQEGEVELDLPDWLQVSTGGNRLLLSDQRNGRWALLSEEHISELRRRMPVIVAVDVRQADRRPPTIVLKGLTVHLQSARRLANGLEEFSTSGRVVAFEETAPFFSLKVDRATEGISVSDSNSRIGLTSREAGKWVGIINAELARLNVHETDRGSVRTVFADSEDGTWVLQWGDELLVPPSLLADVESGTESRISKDAITMKRTNTFLQLLSRISGSCVVLNETEAAALLERSRIRQSHAPANPEA